MTHESERTFAQVHDSDLVTIMESLCGSLEYHSLTTANKVMSEIDARNLWSAVIQRRAHLIHLKDRAVTESDAVERARSQIARFRNRHFPLWNHEQHDRPSRREDTAAPPERAVRAPRLDEWGQIQGTLGRALTRTDLVRLALADGRVRTAKAIRADLEEISHPASAAQIASCLFELVRLGEVSRVQYGTYRLNSSV